MKIVPLLLILCLVSASYAEIEEQVYIPKNLEECFVQLEKIMTEENALKEFKNKSEDEIIEYHFSLGKWIRNNWGLWSGSELAEYFKNMGIDHPDDMSSIILTSFHRDLHGKDIKLEEQIKYYKEYWKKAKENRSPAPK